MAAGRHNISRKRYSDPSKEENHSYKNGYHQKTSGGGRDRCNSERNLSSAGKGHDHRRNGYGDDTVDRECRKSYAASWPVLQGRSKQDSVSENRSWVGSEKKRKFSPIVWDRDEKKARISSKKVPLSCFQLSPPKSSKALGHIVVDARIGTCPVDDDQQISPVESLVSSVSDGVVVPNSVARTPATSPEQHTEDDQELDKMEEGEYVEERNLSKSKWAFEDSPSMVSEVNNSSPESGEFKQEGFKGIEDGSSSSDKAGHFKARAIGEEQSEDDSVMMNVDGKVATSSMGYFSSEEDDDEDYNRTEAAEIPKCSGLDMMQCCRNVFEYERLGKISEGTYGVVYKARDKKTGDIVALKKVKMGKEREGFPVTALREINILGSFHHPSIVEVKEIVMDDFDGVYMVMEYVDHELKGYMDATKKPFSQSEVKCLMIQLLEGLCYLHDNWVIHRDLKTSNLLLNMNGELKICDFGMSRQYGSPVKPYTPLVVTLWYRAPEVLLGTKQYSTAIDMWSVGCIMAELLAKKPLFDGNRELEQIDKIFRTLGTPNDSIWPGYSKLPGVKPNFVKQPYNSLRKKFPVATFTGSPVLTELGFDLLNKLLTYDPKKRITAEEALNHGWFCEAPLPAEHVRICK